MGDLGIFPTIDPKTGKLRPKHVPMPEGFEEFDASLSLLDSIIWDGPTAPSAAWINAVKSLGKKPAWMKYIRMGDTIANPRRNEAYEFLFDIVRRDVLTGDQTVETVNLGVVRGEKGETGASGAGGLTTDAAIAANMRSKATETYKATSEGFIAKNSTMFNIRDNGVVADGTADDTASIQYLIDTVPRGATIWAPPGSVIRSSGLTVTAKAVNLDFENAILIQTAEAPIITATGAWSPSVSVTSAVDNVITMPTSGYAVGDIIKVYSMDIVPDGRPSPTTTGGFPRQGEFAIVATVGASSMTISPRLQDTYSSQVKVTKLLGHKVRIKVGEAYSVAGASGTMFQLSSLQFPELDVRVSKGNGAAVGVRSCYGAQTRVNANNLPTGTGYGLASVASVMGTHHIHATRIRHAYTDDLYQNITSAGEPDPARYGRPMFDTIYGTSSNTAESSWDTHHGGIGHKFVGIVASGAPAQSAFSVRGRGHEWHNCTAFDSANGFRIYDEDDQPWATSHEHLMVGCRTFNVGKPIVASLKSSQNLIIPGPTLVVDGGYFESRDGNNVTVAKSRVHLNNPVFVYKATDVPSNKYWGIIGSGVLTGKARIEVPYLTTGKFDAVIYASNNSTGAEQLIDFEADVVVNAYASTNITAFLWANTITGRVALRLNRQSTIATTRDVTPGNAGLAVTKSTLNSTASGSNSAHRNYSPGAGGFLPLNNSGDPYITFFCTIPAARRLGGATAGAFPGQVLVVQSARDSVGNVIIGNTSTNFGTTTDINITPGTGAMFVWSGTMWEKV